MNCLGLTLYCENLFQKQNFNKCNIVKLSHPRTGIKCVYVLSETDGILYELNKIELPKRSLFVGNQITKCGDVLICTPIDVIFLFLPALMKQDKFTTFDCLNRSDASPGFPHMFTDSLVDRLSAVCEFKTTCGLKVLRLDETKLLSWLDERVNLICKAANAITDSNMRTRLKGVLCDQNKTSATAALYALDSSAAKAIATAEFEDEALKSFAFQLVADKLPGEVINKLHTRMGLLDAVVLIPTPSQLDKENMKMIDKATDISTTRKSGGPTDDYSTDLKASKATAVTSASEAKKMKMAQGSKSIFSFFSKK